MHRKRALAALAVVLSLSACGRPNSTLLSPGTPGIPVALVAGAYTLRVTRSTAGLCFASNGGADTTAQMTVVVAVQGTGWRAILEDTATGTLVLTLTPQGTSVTGRATGTTSAAGGPSLNLDHALTGGADGTPTGASGSITGTVTYTSPAGSSACTENSWTLAKRPA